jgi:hypothetical protein
MQGTGLTPLMLCTFRNDPCSPEQHWLAVLLLVNGADVWARDSLVKVSTSGRQAGRKAERQAERQAGRQKGRQAERQAERQKGRKAERQKGRKAGIKAGIKAGRQAAAMLRIVCSCLAVQLDAMLMQYLWRSWL